MPTALAPALTLVRPPARSLEQACVKGRNSRTTIKANERQQRWNVGKGFSCSSFRRLSLSCVSSAYSSQSLLPKRRPRPWSAACMPNHACYTNPPARLWVAGGQAMNESLVGDSCARLRICLARSSGLDAGRFKTWLGRRSITCHAALASRRTDGAEQPNRVGESWLLLRLLWELKILRTANGPDWKTERWHCCGCLAS